MKRLLDAAAKITGLIDPLERRIAALEATAARSPGKENLETRIARLEAIEAAARAAGAQ